MLHLDLGATGGLYRSQCLIHLFQNQTQLPEEDQYNATPSKSPRLGQTSGACQACVTALHSQ